MVDPFDQDRILHFLAYFGLEVEVLVEDLQHEIDNEDGASHQEISRPKRQNTLLDFLDIFSTRSQSRPRRKPQFADFTVDQSQSSRFPRKFPSNSNSGKNTFTSSNPSLSNNPSFDPQNTTLGMKYFSLLPFDLIPKLVGDFINHHIYHKIYQFFRIVSVCSN